MAVTVIWSQEALDDIDAIAEFISRDSNFYARAVVEKVLATAGSISAFPKIGRIVPESDNDNVRERFVYSYRVIYEIKTSHIEILAVIHGKRLLETTS